MSMSVLSIATRGKVCLMRSEFGLISLDSPEIESAEELKPELKDAAGPVAEAILPPKIVGIDEV